MTGQSGMGSSTVVLNGDIEAYRSWWRVADRHGTVHLATSTDVLGTVLCGSRNVKPSRAVEAGREWPDGGAVCAACAWLASPRGRS